MVRTSAATSPRSWTRPPRGRTALLAESGRLSGPDDVRGTAGDRVAVPAEDHLGVDVDETSQRAHGLLVVGVVGVDLRAAPAGVGMPHDDRVADEERAVVREVPRAVAQRM